MSTNKCRQLSEMFQWLLGANLDELGRACGFVRRTSKLTAAVFVRSCVLAWLDDPRGSLAQVCRYCRESKVDISPSGVHQRFSAEAVALMQAVVRVAMEALPPSQRLPIAVLQHFSHVYITDGSAVSLPAALSAVLGGSGGKASSASMKVWLTFEYLTGRLSALQTVAGKTSDQACPLITAQAEATSLHLFDLGFFDQQRLAEVASHGAYFVSRLQLQTALYVSDTPRHASLDLLAWLQAQTVDHGEVPLWLGRVTRLPVRLIFVRLPATVVAERRRRAKQAAQKKGRTCSQRTLDLLAWSLYVTNVPADWLTIEQVQLIYRLRWQIELLFKLCKSLAALDHVVGVQPHRILCQFYARLLGVIVFHWMVADQRLQPSQRELSLPAAFKRFQRCAPHLARDFASLPRLTTHLSIFLKDCAVFALQVLRRCSPSTLQRLLEA